MPGIKESGWGRTGYSAQEAAMRRFLLVVLLTLGLGLGSARVAQADPYICAILFEEPHHLLATCAAGETGHRIRPPEAPEVESCRMPMSEADHLMPRLGMVDKARLLIRPFVVGQSCGLLYSDDCLFN
jgi:hypothetical protein